MDNDDGPARTVPSAKGTNTQTTGPGGTVEPVDRVAVAKALYQTLGEEPGERYEMRDPFAEVTYRTNSLSEMLLKAERLGSSKFVAVNDQGHRTTVHKGPAGWQREAEPGQTQATAPTPAVAPEAEPTKAPATARLSKSAARDAVATAAPGLESAASVARIDAQAEREALVARLEAALVERYLIKRAPVTVGDLTVGRTEYRFRGDSSRVAFTESTYRLATDTNSPSVARSMVDVAQARNWQALRVSGNEDFRRLVWLESSTRGVKAQGYEPNPADLEVLKREREARHINRIEPDRSDAYNALPISDKASARGSGGRKAVLVAIEGVLVAKRVPVAQREAIMAAASEKLAQRTRDGQSFKVKVYDKAAPSQRPLIAPAPEQQRSRERAAPAR
jgi:hypothetical protein